MTLPADTLAESHGWKLLLGSGYPDEYDVNEHNMAVAVVDQLFETLREDPCDYSAMLSALMTMPHEMAHVVASEGRSPLQVFDDGEGELALTSSPP